MTQDARPAPANPHATTYLLDSRANLIIQRGETNLVLEPGDALDLIKFIERTGYQAHANTLTKGAAQ